MSRTTKPLVERRKYHRTPLTISAFAVIAASSGLITEISPDGMTVHSIDRKARLESQQVLDIVVDAPFCDETSFCLKDLPFSLVSTSSIPRSLPDSSPSVRRMGLQFDELTDAQRTAIQCFIDTVETANLRTQALAVG